MECRKGSLMRGIKFRAWDNLEKRMCKVISLHWRGEEFASAKLEGDNEPIPIEGRLVIEEWTGLYNRAGQEVYVGDILALYRNNGSIGNVCRVIWNELDDEYDWKPVGEDSWTDIFTAFYDDYKVVGNIHENPELLEKR